MQIEPLAIPKQLLQQLIKLTVCLPYTACPEVVLRMGNLSLLYCHWLILSSTINKVVQFTLKYDNSPHGPRYDNSPQGTRRYFTSRYDNSPQNTTICLKVQQLTSRYDNSPQSITDPLLARHQHGWATFDLTNAKNCLLSRVRSNVVRSNVAHPFVRSNVGAVGDI